MLRVVCLCADWCSACRAWQPDWAALAARHPQVQWQWLDIEDEADLMDTVGLDIETFPTVLLMRDDRALHLGPVLPQPAQVEQLMARVGDPSAHPPSPAVKAATAAPSHTPCRPRPRRWPRRWRSGRPLKTGRFNWHQNRAAREPNRGVWPCPCIDAHLTDAQILHTRYVSSWHGSGKSGWTDTGTTHDLQRHRRPHC
jgi:thioredoxin 1